MEIIALLNPTENVHERNCCNEKINQELYSSVSFCRGLSHKKIQRKTIENGVGIRDWHSAQRLH